jgi:hypothetical protein
MRWMDHLRRSRSGSKDQGYFYILGTRPYLYGYDGYNGGHTHC